MKHPDATLIAQYLQTVVRMAEQSSDIVARRHLKYAAANVAAHLTGEADISEEFKFIILKNSPKPQENV